MTKVALLALFALPLAFAGCGEAEQQPGPAGGKKGESNDMPGLCLAIEKTGLAGQCTVNTHDNLVQVTIDNFDDEVARNVCAAIAEKTSRQTAHLSGHWKLQVFSPYRSDKPIADCLLH